MPVVKKKMIVKKVILVRVMKDKRMRVKKVIQGMHSQELMRISKIVILNNNNQEASNSKC